MFRRHRDFVTVPNVIGMSPSRAKREADHAGLWLRGPEADAGPIVVSDMPTGVITARAPKRVRWSIRGPCSRCGSIAMTVEVAECGSLADRYPIRRATRKCSTRCSSGASLDQAPIRSGSATVRSQRRPSTALRVRQVAAEFISPAVKD